MASPGLVLKWCMPSPDPPRPPIAPTVASLREAVGRWRGEGRRVALVPTMGGLHEGHFALVRRGRELCERVVVSIFVNPRQFGAADDFAQYPRRLDADVAALARIGAHLVFAPAVAEMYPDGFATTVAVGGPLTRVLEAVHRPGHFEGVATVVAKLLLQAGADVALFGEKDFQQLQVVRRLVRDLDIPVRIEPVATVRDPDGLALSSRNFNLSQDERRAAAGFPAALFAAAERVRRGDDVPATLAAAGRQILDAGFDSVDYVELAEAETLTPVRVRGDAPCRLFAAATIGRTRLIDNIAI
ncbi:MAG TPA: pantoate--beta-alanine ligase [Stellaceae bacterium]|nr:pantoate--beta-alanine ligase [Stellaceae bacterium]